MKGLFTEGLPPATDTNGVCMALADLDVLVVACDAPGSMATLRHIMDPAEARARFATMPCVDNEYVAGDPAFFVDAAAALVRENSCSAAVLVNGPVGMLIGIDLREVARRVEERCGVPVRWVETTGNGAYDDGFEKGRAIAAELAGLFAGGAPAGPAASAAPAGAVPDKPSTVSDSAASAVGSVFGMQATPFTIQSVAPAGQTAAIGQPVAAGQPGTGRLAAELRQIAFYGKGGIGKSTVAQNVAAALATRLGRRLMLVGCDPKADSTRLLTHDAPRDTVLDLLQDGDARPPKDKLVREGFAGIACVEAGGPEPGVGCAGRGIIAAFEALDSAGAYADALDYVLYDVLGDVVCGGFAMPIRSGRAREVYLVVSGELMSLYAANNICKGLARYAAGGARLAGVICNSRNVAGERDLAEAFARAVGSELVAVVPRSAEVQRAEINRQTVVEFAPESEQAAVYARLAAAIEGNGSRCVPTALSAAELEELMRAHGL